MTNGWHDTYAARLRRVEILLYVSIAIGLVNITQGALL
jgi:hypothetical protein